MDAPDMEFKTLSLKNQRRYGDTVLSFFGRKD
jgi:hypothetical protein